MDSSTQTATLFSQTQNQRKFLNQFKEEHFTIIFLGSLIVWGTVQVIWALSWFSFYPLMNLALATVAGFGVYRNKKVLVAVFSGILVYKLVMALAVFAMYYRKVEKKWDYSKKKHEHHMSHEMILSFLVQQMLMILAIMYLVDRYYVKKLESQQQQQPQPLVSVQIPDVQYETVTIPQSLQMQDSSIHFQEQLNGLRQMGFTNELHNIEVLEKYNGDFMAAVRELIRDEAM
jgi:heme/copper-type cytochrome/quinol oxidase subunit 2